MSDIYGKFLNAQAVVYAWAGGFLGPTFLMIGLSSEKRGHLFFGIIFILCSTLSIYHSFSCWGAFKKSDQWVYFYIPLLTLFFGVSIAYLANT